MTTFSFAGREKEKAAVAGIANSSLDPHRIRMIERENALALFPGFRFVGTLALRDKPGSVAFGCPKGDVDKPR